jgi:dTDP-4-amino-4,6-dideoxygalactose transaminase
MGFDHKETEAVNRVMTSGVLSNYQGNWSDNFYGGSEVQALEKEWAEYFGVKHAIACNSATSGLWMALNAIGLEGEKEGWEPDEVIVSPYTMTCSASLPLLFGAKPVFADIEPDYFCIDPDDIERKITPYTKAIIAVDIFGQPCDFDRINEIAERKGKAYGHKIYVIEDTAQAPGAKYKGRYAGTLGDIGVYSLNRHKHVHCGEGGICVTNDDDLAFKLRLSVNHSEAVVNDLERQGLLINHPEHNELIPMVGMNLRMVELSAAIAREQLKKLDDILKVYREDAKYFPVKVRPECEHSYYRYAWTSGCDAIPCKFNDKTGYIKPIYQMPLFKQLGYKQDQCPVCEVVNQNIVLAWHEVAP